MTIFTRTTREAFLDHGNVQLRGSVAADGNNDRVQLRVVRINSGSYTVDEIWVDATLKELHEYVAELDTLARQNRGLQ